MLQACLNGGRAKSEHPAIPCTAEELAADARAASAFGAAEFHIHPRGADSLESLGAGRTSPPRSGPCARRAAR